MPTVKDILQKVEDKERNTQTLRNRWASDYNLWRLAPYMGLGSGYENYTSNEPRTNSKKAIGMISGAIRKITVPEGNDNRSQQDQDNQKERFLIGNFKANDERLIKIGLTGTLQQTMAWQMIVRGTTCGRALFRRHPISGRPIADATPWDPMDTFWEYGSDGLAWICHRTLMLRSAVEGDWQINLPDDENDPGQQIIPIYDWYDRDQNIVVTELQDEPLKEAIHGVFDGDGQPRVPAWVSANTLQPMVTPPRLSENTNLTAGQLNEGLADYGESFFADSRHQYDASQMMASIRLNLTKRSLKPVFSIKSESGVRRVEYDPFKEGAEIPLQINEDFIVHDMLQSAPDTDPLTGIVHAEREKGGFPAISFGNLNDPISGFAIQNLKGGVADKVIGGVQGVNHAHMTVGNIWSDHFATGAFGGMELSGQGRNRRWFSSVITPDMIRDQPQAEIELVPELPEDQAAMINNAIQLRTPGADGRPLLDDYGIREDVLARQDSGFDADRIDQQMANNNPLINAQRTTDALANRGDEGAQWAHVEFITRMVQIQASLKSMGIDLNDVLQSFNQGKSQGSPTQPGGFPPQVLPPSAQGTPTSTPGVNTPAQAGPLVPAGTPRPGAQAPLF